MGIKEKEEGFAETAKSIACELITIFSALSRGWLDPIKLAYSLSRPDGRLY